MNPEGISPITPVEKTIAEATTPENTETNALQDSVESGFANLETRIAAGDPEEVKNATLDLAENLSNLGLSEGLLQEIITAGVLASNEDTRQEGLDKLSALRYREEFNKF